MIEKERAIATDLKRLDAHVVQPEEYEDAPELTADQLAEADLHQGGRLIRRGRPPSATRKQPVKLRIDPDVLAAYRASGPGWQTRMVTILRKAAMRTMKPATAVKALKKNKAVAIRASARKKVIAKRRTALHRKKA